MKSIKVPGTSTDDIFIGKFWSRSSSGMVQVHVASGLCQALRNNLIFLASKGIKQTKSEIKHSSESVSSTEEDGKPSDQVHDVWNVRCNKHLRSCENKAHNNNNDKFL